MRASVRWLREPAMEVPMEDVVFVAVTLAIFAILVLLVRGVDRL